MNTKAKRSDELLAARVREGLTGTRRVQEKKMFGGVAFMVGGKMCVTVGHGRMMCRVDPARHDALVQRKGCRTMTMRGREYRGYVVVDAAALRARAVLQRWLALALEFNRQIRR